MKKQTNQIKFNNLSAAEKRILIAKDAIKQLQLNKYVAEKGCWVSLNLDEETRNQIEDGKFKERNLNDYEQEWQGILQRKEVSCQVCGLGAVFASAVRLNNNYVASPFADVAWKDLYPRLAKYFSMDQLAAIEIAFEGGDGMNWFEEDGFAGPTAKIIKSVKGNSYKHLSYNKLNQAQKNLFTKALKFSERYDENQKCLLAIMRNIVKNNGKFVP